MNQEWQYLTDDEIKEIVGGYGNEGGIGGYTRELFDKIEAKIREKNTPQQWYMVNKDGYVKPLSDEEIGDCVDDCFGLMALQHKYTYSIDQVQEYGLKLCKAIEERHGIK